jgi:hypothetical protein
MEIATAAASNRLILQGTMYSIRKDARLHIYTNPNDTFFRKSPM